MPDSLDPVPLTSDVASNDPFVAPGAPAAMTELHLAAVSGMVMWPDAPMPNGASGISLVCWQVMAGLSLHGLSGAPVLTGNMEKAVGVIRWNPPQAESQELARGAEVYAAPAGRILRRWPELAQLRTCRSWWATLRIAVARGTPLVFTPMSECSC